MLSHSLFWQVYEKDELEFQRAQEQSWVASCSEFLDTMDGPLTEQKEENHVQRDGTMDNTLVKRYDTPYLFKFTP